MPAHEEIVAVIRDHAGAAGPGRDAFAPLLERARKARLMLLGEASHGTHEFYARRAELTKRLIRDQVETARGPTRSAIPPKAEAPLCWIFGKYRSLYFRSPKVMRL